IVWLISACEASAGVRQGGSVFLQAACRPEKIGVRGSTMSESTHLKELFDPRPAKETLKTYEDLLQAIRASERDYDLALIEKSYTLAEAQHHVQRRLSGAPYISHPLAVACILVELGMDTESVVAGLL